MAALRVCKLADISTGKTISGSDACRPGRPARMSVDKCKLHYFVHYMHRGSWDELVPEEKEEELGKIEAYHCNLCPRRFRNNHEKKSYPGRGSMMCHLATEHGHLLKAMRNDDKVDMAEEIDAINEHEKGKFVELGLPEVPDNEMYTAKESFMWKFQNGKTNMDGGNGTTSCQSATANNNTPIIGQRPKTYECPHCNDCKNNMDPSRLRLHIFHHYKDRWEHRLDKLEKGPNYFYCDMCPKRKQLKGANEEGARMSTICHYAIQHHELRDVLNRDERLPEKFVEDLYYDIDLKEGKINQNKPAENTTPVSVKPAVTKTEEPVKKAPEAVKKAPEPTRGRRPKAASKPKDEWLSSDDENENEAPRKIAPKSKGKAAKAPPAKKTKK